MGFFFLSSHSDKQVSVAIAWFYPLETAGQTIQDNILTPKSYMQLTNLFLGSDFVLTANSTHCLCYFSIAPWFSYL